MTTATTLSDETVANIKATTGAVSQHGKAIAARMYGKMRDEHPELIALFSEENPGKGIQAENLANALLAYARNIDRLGALDGAIDRIAAAHRRAGVEPAHYPVIGDLLLRSMKEELGEAADNDVMQSWEQAYFYLADILIQRESL